MLEVIVQVKDAKSGKAKTFKMIETVESRKAKDGSMTMAIYQPSKEAKLLAHFGKLYIDPDELKAMIKGK